MVLQHKPLTKQRGLATNHLQVLFTFPCTIHIAECLQQELIFLTVVRHQRALKQSPQALQDNQSPQALLDRQRGGWLLPLQARGLQPGEGLHSFYHHAHDDIIFVVNSAFFYRSLMYGVNVAILFCAKLAT